MPVPIPAKDAKLSFIIPGWIIIKAPIKPTVTAHHLFIPTFSFNNKEDNIVTIIGATKAKVNAFAKEITEIE